MTINIEIPVRIATNTDISAATTENYKRIQREKWFSCNDVLFTKQNQGILRRSLEDRETSIEMRIYTSYCLTQYACVFDNVDILKEIYKSESDFVTTQEITLIKNDTKIIVPKGCTHLMVAIACNSTQAVQYLLTFLNMKDVKIQLNDRKQSASTLAAMLPHYHAAQAALKNVNLQTKEFYFSDSNVKNIVEIALEYENEFLMHLFTKLLATPRQDPIMKFALMYKGESSDVCKDKLSLIVNHALEKAKSQRLYLQPDWEKSLQVYFEGKFEEKIQQWKDAEEETKLLKETADILRSQQPPQFKSGVVKYQIPKKPIYDFDSNKPVVQMEFELQAKPFNVPDQQVIVEEVAQSVNEQKQDEKFNLFDAAQESLIPVLISQYSNTFQPSRPEQLAAARNFASDDRVVPLQQQQINWFNVCKDGNLQLCKSMIRVHAGEVDTRQTDAEKLIYNGFTGIHYATVFGRWQIVQLLMQYEALQTTKARVILKAPGVGQDRAVVVPLQSNALQLACYCNQVQIFKLIVDSLISPRPVYIDPIQLAFSRKNAPLDATKQKQILTQKNELEQTALAVLAQCRVLTNELCKNIEKEDYVLQLCLDQLDSNEVLDFNDQFVTQNAYLFNNQQVLKTLRQQLLTNPCNKLSKKVYAELLFKVYDLLMDMKNSEECEEVLPTLKISEDVQHEVDLTLKLIEAQVFVNRKFEDQEAEKPENQNQEHLEEHERFKKHFKNIFAKYIEQIQNSFPENEQLLESLQHPQYIQQFGNELFCKKHQKELIKHEDLEYLSSVVQKQDLSYYFDCVINGYERFVIDLIQDPRQCDAVLGQIDRRQSRDRIINGFTALLYACYYGHLNLVKILLEKEFGVRQGDQIKVEISKDKNYIFKELINAYQAAILSKASNSKQIIDYITDVAKNNEEVAQTLFMNHKQTSDMLKLAVISENDYIFQNSLIREFETGYIYLQLKEKPLTPTIIYTICEYHSISGMKFLQDIILADSIANNQQNSDIPISIRAQIESNLLFSIQLACLQRIDGSCPLDHIRKCQNKIAIKFINDLTNDAILRALTIQQCESLLESYYGDMLPEIAQKFQDHGDLISGKIVHRYLSNGEVYEYNGFVADEKINRISFEPIQKLNEVDIWFEMCKYGTLQQVQALARSFVGRREIRYNNYDRDIHQGFTGLMYATLFNTLDVVLFLMDFEGMLCLDQDCLVKSKTGAFLIPIGLSPLHIAAVVADQYVIDAFFQFYTEHQHEINNEISISRYLIIHNKRANQEQLLKDFQVDNQLLRIAVQYARTEFLSIMGELCQSEDYFGDFYKQLLTPFSFREQDMTIQHLIWELPSQTYTKLNQKDILETVNFIEQAIKKVLIVMIQQKILHENSLLIDQFFKSNDYFLKIQEAYDILSEPKMVQEESIQELAQIQFFRVTDDLINEQEIVTNLSMQTEQQNDWFRACRDNDMETVHQLFKQHKQSRDGRQTSFINCVHTGFCGLHYAMIYSAKDVQQFLFDFEWNVVTGSDTIVRGDQGRYFVPARSTILHLIAMKRNEEAVQLIKTKPSAEGLVNAKNRLGVVPIELFAGQNYIERFVFETYLQNFNDEQLKQESEVTLRSSFVHCCKANNYEFAQLCVQNVHLYAPIVYKHVFSIWKQDLKNKAEMLFMKQKDEALEYALLYRMEEQWSHTLDAHFDEKRSEVEAEYQNLKIWQTEQYELVEEEKLFEGPNSVVIEGTNKINEPKTLQYLRESKMSEDQHKWFAACKTGDVAFIKKNKQFVKLQDQSLTNFKTKTYTQFTGLMYAIVYNQLNVVKELVRDELLIYSSCKNLVEIPNDDEELPADQKIGTRRFYLFRTCYPVILSVICHRYEIFAFFVQELKTQEDMLYNQFTYDTMVTVDFQIPYSYMMKLMALADINLIKVVLLIQKDSHMKYLCDFLTSDVDQYNIAKQRPTADKKIIKQALFDVRIYMQILSQLDDQSILRWRELGENSSYLIDKAIDFGLAEYYEPDVMQCLYNIYGQNALERAKNFKKSKFLTDLVVDVAATTHNCYILDDEMIAEKPVEEEDEALKQQHLQLDQFLEAVKNNDTRLVKKGMFEYGNKPDLRPTDFQNTIFRGWTGIHYAAYLNNIPMLSLLWQIEKYAETKEDVIIDALGTGFGNKYLLSKHSNAIMIAALQDNKESVQMMVNLAMADKDVEKFYLKPNFRNVNLLYISCLTWRATSGQILFQSKMIITMLRQIVQNSDQRLITTIQTIIFTNCAFVAKLLYELSQTDLQFKQWFYQVVLENQFVQLHGTHEKQTWGSPAEKQFVSVWLDQIYEDALNFALKLMTEVTWNRIVSVNLGNLIEIVQKQFGTFKNVLVRQGRIQLDDSLLMNQTVQKQQQLQTINKTMNKTGRGKFNTLVNQTQVQDPNEIYQLPQQAILQQTQVVLSETQMMKQPPGVLGQIKKGDGKFEEMQELWNHVEEGQ